MALEGTLRDFSLADIFQLIGLQRKTGVLTLRCPEDVVTISFLEGRVVGADSLNKRLEDRLGQVLLRTSSLTQDDLERALKVQMETLERLGHILLRLKLLSRDGLKDALEQQILQIIYRVFRWQDGDYHFSQETSIDYDQELVTPMGAESILMEGARMLDEWPIIEKRIPHRGIVFVRTAAADRVEPTSEEDVEAVEEFEFDIDLGPSQPTPPGKIRVSPLEAEVLDLLDGHATVDDIVRQSTGGEFETCKALYNLVTRSLIREATREELAAARAAGSSPTRSDAPRPGTLPWLALALVPLFVVSAFLAPRNPLNPLLGPGPRLASRLPSAISWARMWGVWEALQASATLTGSYPDTLSEIAHEGFIPASGLHDPWDRPYRYVLREQSVLLGGSNAVGSPDPNLLLVRHLASATRDTGGGPGATLLEP
ncbi:MAG: DUF4388 domain-containing protein [Acidobacteriota bacterium]